jgi:hypothetical protein
MTLKMKLGLVAAFVVLAIVAVAGWARRTPPATPAYTASSSAQPIEAATAVYDQYGQPAATMSPAYLDTTVASFNLAAGTLPEFANPRCVRTVRRDMPAQPVYQRPLPYGDADRAYPEPRSYSASRYVESRDVRHRRSTRRSAEIVAGSAGVGAAIGAIAGGGKGAGIGALAGGGGGFVYDRLTRNNH